MYYPYLRGKQFELIALRDFAEHYENTQCVFPIIEPVRLSIAGLCTALKSLNDATIPAAVVLNPTVGEFAEKHIDLKESIKGIQAFWTPAFLLSGDIKAIKQSIESENYDKVILIIPPDKPVQEEETLSLCALPEVEKILLPLTSIKLKRKLKLLGKSLVAFSDNFKPRITNAEYADQSIECFSEMYCAYKDEGYIGVADYTPLPGEFSEGGWTPSTVVIHLTYEEEESVFIKHFVSAKTFPAKANIQGKFADAAQKTLAFCAERGIETNAIEQLRDWYDASHYPGLGAIKKITILNHLELAVKIHNMKQR
ncbi:MAG: sce7725 family protein [Akkermansia sp.]|nr:sce7725 family protein [Akkermansia sp.]